MDLAADSPQGHYSGNHLAVTIHVTERVSNMNTKVRTLVSGEFRTGERRVEAGPEEAMAL